MNTSLPLSRKTCHVSNLSMDNLCNSLKFKLAEKNEGVEKNCKNYYINTENKANFYIKRIRAGLYARITYVLLPARKQL